MSANAHGKRMLTLDEEEATCGICITWPTKSFLGAIAGSGDSPCLMRLGFAKVTTSGRPPLSRVRPLWASWAASAADACIEVVTAQQGPPEHRDV